jgi:hypothetical protein
MKTPTHRWTFESSSSNKTYETLKYDDGSLSCDCPGWCRRVSQDGSRTCKHVRAVQCGEAGSGRPLFPGVEWSPLPKQQPALPAFTVAGRGRLFDLED